MEESPSEIVPVTLDDGTVIHIEARDLGGSRKVGAAEWFAELAAGAAPLRILLLERHADPDSGWWQTAFQRGWE